MARRVSSPRFVGREAELDVLDALLLRAADGAGGSVLVAGEAGIGKSRLMAQLEGRAAAANAVVLVGECLEFAGGQLAFAPMVAVLRPVVDDPELLAGLDPVLRSAVTALWPGSGSAAAPASEREQLFEAVYRVLARLSASQPVLLIVEDVHWIDPSSRDLVAFIVHNTRRDRVMVVMTYRTDELRRGHPLRPFVAELPLPTALEAIIALKIIGLSVNQTSDHERWARDIAETPRLRAQLPHHRRRGLRGCEAVRDVALGCVGRSE